VTTSNLQNCYCWLSQQITTFVVISRVILFAEAVLRSLACYTLKGKWG